MKSNEGKTLRVLGLNIGGHDSSAALVVDGQLIAMVEQERLSRNKRATGEAPIEAMYFCLESAGLELNDLTAIALGWDMDKRRAWQGLTIEEIEADEQLDSPQRLFPGVDVSVETFPPIIPIEHHFAHAASTFWASGFGDAAILIADNRGEDASTTLAHGNGSTIDILQQHAVPESLGLFYRAAAEYAGLAGKAGEVGKLMGLASYGVPVEPMPLEFSHSGPRMSKLPAIPPMRNENLHRYRKRQLLDYFSENCFPYAPSLSEEIMAYANFASSVQQALQESLLGLMNTLKSLTNSDRLVVAGGVGLNCTANGAIARSRLFKDTYVQPVAHDGGVSLGAALAASISLRPSLATEFEMEHVYWGPEFSQEAINDSFDSLHVPYKLLPYDELIRTVASLMAEGNVIGWFQGRAEVGPRALGGRSLLADPRSRKSLIRLNGIKRREMWRPLAPSVLEEHFASFFTGPLPSPFMLVATQVRPSVKARIPAVVHVDGSSRPQSVSRKTAPLFWQLIKRFHHLTGIPLIVNTSFNLDREPIVNRPEEAIRDFLSTDIDVLAIGNAISIKCRMP